MDCSILMNGMVVRNYKEMCGLLGETVKTGNSRTAQMNEWRRYFRYERDKQRFRIAEVYDVPAEKLDGRAGRTVPRRAGRTVDLVEPLLLDLLCLPSNRGELTMPKNEIYQKLGMVNSEYSKHCVVYLNKRKNQGDGAREYEVCSFLDEDEHEINGEKIKNEMLLYFYEAVSEIMAKAFRSAVVSMEKRGIIKCENWYEIKQNDGTIEVADRIEGVEISEFEQTALENMNVGRKNIACLPENRHRFYKERNAEVRKNKNWNKVKDVFKVYLMVKEEAVLGNPKIKSVSSCGKTAEELRRELNGIIAERVLDCAERDCAELNISQSGSDEAGGSRKVSLIGEDVLRDKTFLSTQEFLVENLIKI